MRRSFAAGVGASLSALVVLMALVVPQAAGTAGSVASAATACPAQQHVFSAEFGEGLAVDSSGAVWVANFETAVITKYDAATGAVLATIAPTAGTPNLERPIGLAIDGSDNLYVADRDSDTVYRFNSSGTQTLASSPSGDATPEPGHARRAWRSTVPATST